MKEQKLIVEEWFRSRWDGEVSVTEEVLPLGIVVKLRRGSKYADFLIDYDVFTIPAEMLDAVFQAYIDKANEILNK